MSDSIKISEIYDKNLNFIIGSGASFGLFPTLSVGLKDKSGNNQTIETLATYFSQRKNSYLNTLLFMYYYRTCIEPASHYKPECDFLDIEAEKEVLKNYEAFMNTILTMLYRRKISTRRCNIFTTNYDGCFERAADDILANKKLNFIMNDGTSGFRLRTLHSKNFHSFLYETGVFGKYKIDVPQINLVHLHGSTFWQKHNSEISVNYSDSLKLNIKTEFDDDYKVFASIVEDDTKKISDLELESKKFTEKDTECFWAQYKNLPIVNPTKWKFHEAVFEEHYYEMLRYLSYELEKPNSVVVTFGFSFADEHILNLVLRAVSNPSLQIFVCCFNEDEKINMTKIFEEFKNVTLVTIDENLTFSKFNENIFNSNTRDIEKNKPDLR